MPQTVRDGKIQQILLGIITGLLSIILGLGGYFGNKYINLTEQNRDSLIKMSAGLEMVITMSVDQKAAIAEHSKEIGALQVDVKLIQKHHADRKEY